MEDLSMRVTQLELLVEHLYTSSASRSRRRTRASARVCASWPSSGNKIGAIKLYREETGCDLKSAHEVIDRLG